MGSHVGCGAAPYTTSIVNAADGGCAGAGFSITRVMVDPAPCPSVESVSEMALPTGVPVHTWMPSARIRAPG